MYKELTPSKIIFSCDTEDIKPNRKVSLIPEYDYAYSKIIEALQIKKDGYNVYLIDDFSKDKLNNIVDFIKDFYKDKEAPKDICYVVDEDDKRPKTIYLNSGKGNIFGVMVEDLENIYYDSTYDFYNTSANKEKEKMIDSIQKKKNELMSKLIELAGEDGFEIKSTRAGFTFIPVKEGESMTEKEYDALSAEEKDLMLDKITGLKNKAQYILEDIKNIESNKIEDIKKLLKEHLQEKTKSFKEELKKVFGEEKDALNFLNKMSEEIENNLCENYSIGFDEDEEKINEIIYRYVVNVLVDNSEISHPRVIYEEDPSITNLLGNIDYENHNGIYTTDVTLIKAGSILKANGGCLIVRASNLLSNSSAYYYLKKCLTSGVVNFDYNKGYLELLSLSSLKPESININTKIIIIGDYEIYDVLYNVDEDFKKLFKIRAEYNPIVDIDENSKYALFQGIDQIIYDNNLLPLDDEAKEKIVKYLARLAENKKKIYFNANELNKLIMISNIKAKNRGSSLVEKADILESINNQEIIEKEILERYKEKRMFINTKGSSIGEINGLSVISTGYFSLGKPIRITCSCYKGDGSIIDVHKENNLSGKIHNKSISILKGYLNSVISMYTKLPVDFHLSFEQVYGEIDGDSASVAEILAMLSALSKIPIKQNISVTGSINQFGEIQPIGGVNEKIEGFFKICKIVDTIEGKGVLIPESNKDDLVLNEEVEEAVNLGKFHIYTARTVQDAVELLFGENKITFKEVLNSIEKEIKKYNKNKN